MEDGKSEPWGINSLQAKQTVGYQIAFLACQQNKLTPSRRTSTALTQRDRYILFSKRRTKELPQDQITSHTASKHRFRTQGLIHYISAKQRKGFFQSSFPERSIRVSTHLDFLQQGLHAMNAKSLQASTGTG